MTSRALLSFSCSLISWVLERYSSLLKVQPFTGLWSRLARRCLRTACSPRASVLRLDEVDMLTPRHDPGEKFELSMNNYPATQLTIQT